MPANRFAAWAASLAAAALAPAAAAVQAPPPSAERGADVFADRCASCHGLQGVHQGPSLIGVVGRKAASLPGYAYSSALKASGLVWTAPTLGRFIAGPQQLVPGTAMLAAVPDPRERQDVIAFLATLAAK